jgi:hypothetical protein
VDLVEAVVGGGVHAALGSARLLEKDHWDQFGTVSSRGRMRTLARTVVSGSLLALVPLAVFGALFVSADRVFAELLGDLVRIDLEAVSSHVAVTGVLSWIACGYLVGVSGGTRLVGIRRFQPAGPTLGLTEVALAMALVDLLFLGFVMVQFRYLFGGASWVEITPGLTYATYARAGFFQLVAAVALAIPWLLTTHCLLGDRRPRARWVFRGLAGVLILLLLVIVASAIQRMLAYQSAYGLTEERVMVTAVLVWLTGVVVWFAMTVFGGRRDRFAFGALVGAFFLVGALQVINPAGLVARHNLDRGEGLGGLDVEYLTSLGSDATPFLLNRIDQLKGRGQCVVARRLLTRWERHRDGDWRSFNWSETRARQLVEENIGFLQELAPPGGCS